MIFKMTKIYVKVQFALLAAAFAAEPPKCYKCTSSGNVEGECKSVSDDKIVSCPTGQCYTIQERALYSGQVKYTHTTFFSGKKNKFYKTVY